MQIAAARPELVPVADRSPRAAVSGRRWHGESIARTETNASTRSWPCSTAAVAALVVPAFFVQAWLLAATIVPALDCVNFVAQSQAFARDGWLATLERESAPPLFAALIYGVHTIITGVGWADERNWALAAQLAAALPLLVAPSLAFALFRNSVSLLAAWAAGVLLAVIAVVARLGADGLSDGLHLVCVLAALVATARYLASLARNSDADTRANVLWLAASGLATGLALLCRVEAAIVLPSIGLTLALETFWRRSLSPRHLLSALAALAAGTLLIVVPYLLLSGACSVDGVSERLFGRRGPLEAVPFNCSAAEADAIRQLDSKPDWRLSDGRPMAFGRKELTTSTRFRGPGAAALETLRELAQSLHYVLGLLAVFGLWQMRRTIHRPIDRFLITLFVLYCSAAVWMASETGYLAGRHLLPIVAIALPWAAAGALEVGTLLTRALFRRSSAQTVISEQAEPWIGLSFVAALAVACLVSTLSPRHGARLPHRQAIAWLESPAARPGAVLDSTGLTALDSGRRTYRYRAAPLALRDPDLAYVLVEQAEFMADSDRGATMRELLTRCARPAAVLSPQDSQSPAAALAGRAVLIFEWQGEAFARCLGERDAR